MRPTQSPALDAVVKNYRRIEARLRAMQKDLESLPKTPATIQLLLNNQASLESATQSVKLAEAALDRGRQEQVSA